MVEAIIKDIGLSLVSHRMIGGKKGQGLSNGERKRLAIASELVTDPSIILLDEPTSGLDSFKALAICKLLRHLAHDKGKTVLATIHTPSSEAFFYFDKLILMMDGHIVY